MPIDLARFHAVFIAESLEQLEVMESELLAPDVAQASSESINKIFRAAHSIKGGSATFGFDEIAGLTHLLETLLDQVRARRRQLDPNLIDLLLQSVDSLRATLHGYEAGQNQAHPALAEVQHRLGQLAGVTGDWQPEGDNGPNQAGQRWKISFAPHPHLLAKGNDPYRLLRELAEFGPMDVAVDLAALPRLSEMDAEACYLSWMIELRSEVPRADIDELFEWVVDDCELHIIEADLAADTDAEAAGNDWQGLAGAFAGTTLGTSIRVDTDKIDQLIDLVGELVISDSMLRQLIMPQQETGELDPVQEAVLQLSAQLVELQESALKMRMLPISFCFSRLPRIVRELGKELGKEATLALHGEQTEVDKTVLEKISDPLIHLVRNAIDHGIEAPAERVASGKPPRATITVAVAHQGGNVVVDVSDDGNGLDYDAIVQRASDRGLIAPGNEPPEHEAYALIFSPGFSTASAVTDVSGRGVGLDIVRRNIESLGGHVRVESQRGSGTTFSIALPLTLAIIDGQLVRIGDAVYIVPLLAIIENCRVDEKHFKSAGGTKGLYQFRDAVVPVLDLAKIWRLGSARTTLDRCHMIIVEAAGRLIGLLVDELLDQQQAVIKSLEQNFRAVAGISGATILGDGTIALILDTPGLVKMVAANERSDRREQA